MSQAPHQQRVRATLDGPEGPAALLSLGETCWPQTGSHGRRERRTRPLNSRPSARPEVPHSFSASPHCHVRHGFHMNHFFASWPGKLVISCGQGRGGKTRKKRDSALPTALQPASTAKRTRGLRLGLIKMSLPGRNSHHKLLS